MKKAVVYTDGACDPNPGRGGWAALVVSNGKEKMISGYDPISTNNRMEMTAAIRAFQSIKDTAHIDIFTDSQYLMKGITEWMPKWIQKNWRSTSGKVANRDLWEELLEALKPHHVHWHWVKGHAGDEYNQRVNWAAVRARRKISD